MIGYGHDQSFASESGTKVELIGIVPFSELNRRVPRIFLQDKIWGKKDCWFCSGTHDMHMVVRHVNEEDPTEYWAGGKWRFVKRGKLRGLLKNCYMKV